MPSRLPVSVLYGLSVLFWGTSWYGVALQLGAVPPLASIAYRFVIAAGLLLAFCRLTGRRLRYPPRDHLLMAAQGLFLFSLNYLFFYAATGMLPSGVVAVTFSTITLMNIGNGALFFGTPVDRRVLGAAILGILGLALVFWPQIARAGAASGAGFGLVLSLLATYSASLGNMISVRLKRSAIPVVESNAIGMSYGAAFTLLAAFATGVTFRFDWSAAYLGSLVYLAVCASVLGFGCYLTLVQRIGADRAAYASVLFPVVALGLSTLFEGYRWSWAAAAGVALVLAGNVIVLARRAAPLAAGPRAVRGEDYRARLHASDGAASRGIDAR